jgi:hypothetical protein
MFDLLQNIKWKKMGCNSNNGGKLCSIIPRLLVFHNVIFYNEKLEKL